MPLWERLATLTVLFRLLSPLMIFSPVLTVRHFDIGSQIFSVQSLNISIVYCSVRKFSVLNGIPGNHKEQGAPRGILPRGAYITKSC
ncbi:hypothetical protein IW262DRAFT_1404732 [Armillaria fumosa]|nr:hypothetical protein IW262DRAFT_1404732 [Armillaria fumosa]